MSTLIKVTTIYILKILDELDDESLELVEFAVNNEIERRKQVKKND